jgi:hypothetical protein
MKSLLISLLTLTFLLAIVDDANAQRRKTKKRRTDRTEDTRKVEEVNLLKDRLTYELGLGNLSLFGRNFEAGARASVGYKLTNFLTAGVTGKYIFNLFNNGVESISSSRRGVGPFVNLKVYEGFYAKGLYEFGRYDQIFSSGSRLFKDPLALRAPWAGIGRVQGNDTWSFGFELLFPLDNDVRNAAGILEYYAMFSYNF